MVEYYRYRRCCGCKRWAEKEAEIQVPSRCCNKPWEYNELNVLSETMDKFKEEGMFDHFTESVLKDFAEMLEEKLSEFNMTKKESSEKT